MSNPFGPPAAEEKMGQAEFDELYNRAVARLEESRALVMPESVEVRIRALVRDELARLLRGGPGGQAAN